MSGKNPAKTDLEKCRDVTSQLKEMRHYAGHNVEKLSEFWLMFDSEKIMPEFLTEFETLLALQSNLHDTLKIVAADFEIACNKTENETA